MNTLQIVSLVLIAGGIAWAVWQGNRPIDTSPPPTPAPPRPEENATGSEYTRVEVFALVDNLREWFLEQGNTPGAEAMRRGSQALIESEPPADPERGPLV